MRTPLHWIGSVALFVLLSSQLAIAGLTFEDIEKLIDKNKITSIEGLLAKLPTDFRSKYTLVNSSKSQQFASFENPRVIMYGEDAKLVLAFTGDPNEKGFNILEVIQWREESKSFEFREITFPIDRSKPIPKNPKKCKGCHGGENLRPNWSPYPHWLGFYGSQDDRVGPDNENDQKNSPRPYNEELAIAEANGLESLKKNAAKHPRYRYLEGLEDRFSLDPKDPQKRLRGMANIELTDHFVVLNSKRLARLIRATPNYDSFKYAIAAVLNYCYSSDKDQAGHWRKQRVQDFFPEHCEAPKEVVWIEHNGETNYEQEMRKKVGRTYLGAYDYTEASFEQLFRYRGIDISSWPMIFGSVAYKGPDAGKYHGAGSDWPNRLLPELVDADPDLQDFFSKGGDFKVSGHQVYDYSAKDCKSLAKKSREELAKLFSQDSHHAKECAKSNSGDPLQPEAVRSLEESKAAVRESNSDPK